jgi:hypothetical protein
MRRSGPALARAKKYIDSLPPHGGLPHTPRNTFPARAGHPAELARRGLKANDLNPLTRFAVAAGGLQLRSGGGLVSDELSRFAPARSFPFDRWNGADRSTGV